MNKLLLSLFLFASFCGKTKASTLNMLNEVNAEWKNNVDGQILAASVNSGNIESFNNWIATHLMLVEQTLRQRSVQQLSATQKANRFKLLEELNAYWRAGKFPVNDYLTYKNPVFIDRIGTHCAVGYLMQQSGAELLARTIDAENKFVYVKNIKTNGVSKWAFENGFTIDELAWIQPGYPALYTATDMERGLNGTVRALIVDPVTQLLYVGGSFNASTKGAVCNGVAVYISGIAGWDWLGLGSGVNGKVNTLLVHNNKLYVGGEFTMAGTLPASNVAVYDLNTQQWQSVGNLDSTVNILAVYNNEIYAGGKFTGLLSKWTGSQWQDITSGYIYGGEVRTLEVWNNKLMIGGSFEVLTGALRRYVATYDGIQMGNSGFGTITPVNDFEILHDTIYAACDVVVGTDSCALARCVIYDWEVVMKPFSIMMDYFNGTSIQKLTVAENRLFGAGDFHCASGMYFGNGMMEIIFDASTGAPTCIPLLVVDSTVRTMLAHNNIITFGGDFIATQADTLNHVGQLFNILTGVSGTAKLSSNSIIVFPNPAIDKINIQFKDFTTLKACYINISDETGREIINQKINQSLFSMDFTGNAAGLYMVQVVDSDGITLESKKVVVR
jgi:hypothetical protein